jgi:hypothetical protein
MTDSTVPTLTAEGNHLVVRVPLKFKRRGGRKEVIVPPWLQRQEARRARTNNALVIALARAHRWKDVLEQGRCPTIRDLAAAIGMDNSYVARILRLTLLAPDIIEAILEGAEPSGLSLGSLLNIPVSWQDQRERWGFPAQ